MMVPRRANLRAAAALPVIALMLPAVPAASAGTATTLYSFCSEGGNSCTDGIEPVRNRLTFDAYGNIYGTTYDAGPSHGGEVFRLAPSGALTVLLSFPDAYGGGAPAGGVLMDKAGNLYGATGDHVFRLDPNGTETLLHRFTGTNGDGATVFSGLYRDKKGSLYGTTLSGGSYGYGIMFKVTPDGHERILHSFNGIDGASVAAAPIMDRAGNLYGTAAGGGLNNCNSGCGTVYEIAKGGTFSVLYSFTGGDDGAGPVGGLAIDDAGNLYGTATTGGPGNCGTVFEIAADGTEHTLYAFAPSDTFQDGCNPVSQPMLGKKGRLYGTTRSGGDFGNGTVFKITLGGKERILYSFAGTPDGAQPDGALVKHNRDLYGTTVRGGANGWGTVYKVSR